MARFLIVYETKEGHTAKIAKSICKEISANGHEAEAIDTGRSPRPIQIQDYDCILIGAPVHASQYPKKLESWVKKNSFQLSRKPSAFFSVCLGILQTNQPEVLRAENKIVEGFLSRTGWKPKEWTIFPGALSYSKYNWLKKRIMRRIARKAGGDTDMSRDYEYTNWQEVKDFAHRMISGTSP